MQSGEPFEVTRLTGSDLEAGQIKAPWLPLVDHPSIPKEQAEELAPKLIAELLLALHVGAWRVETQWNRLLPGHEFTGVEGFLKEHWQGKA